MKTTKILCAWLALNFAPKVWAACASLVKGPITVDILACSAFQPEKAFSSYEPKYNFIRDLPPAQRKVFLDSYRGIVVKAKVARSLAVRNGLSPEKGALAGETIDAFIAPQTSNCELVQKKRLQAVIDEVCCEGGGEPPCLLGWSYVLKKPAVIGEMNTKAGHADAKLSTRPDYRQALGLLSKRDFKSAVSVLEKLQAANQLDVQGQFLLSVTYRELDKCAAALPLLEGLFKKFERSDFWSDDETYVRRGIMLYARCLAMLQKTDEAALVLSSLLVEPNKYRKEIMESFNHRDFGYIKTAKAYLDYRAAANKALGQNSKP